MDSYNRFYRAMFVWHRTMSKSMGHDIYDLNWKPGFASALITGINCTVVCFILYTLYFYDNFTRLNCILYFGICVQVSIQHNNFIGILFEITDWKIYFA